MVMSPLKLLPQMRIFLDVHSTFVESEVSRYENLKFLEGIVYMSSHIVLVIPPYWAFTLDLEMT